ncbi:membrane metallo-endopeptidase-like 1 [Prorops nasuta]|uniref:membrane metallo-endopeptidase-like 1 n=1 Tax=Prorops nasuta TaxID=863751 RepID=UPI0034CEE4A7
MYKIVTHSAFYVLKYVPDSKMPHIQRLMLQEPQLALHHSLNKNGAMVQTYKAYIYHIVKYICAGAERTVSEFQLNQDINDMIDLEMELSTIVTPTAFSNSQDNYKVTTVEQFQKIYDNHGGKHPHAMFDWLNKLKEEIGKPELDITKSEIIIVKYISYFTKLPKILKKYRSRTLVNYMAWNLVRSIIPLGDSKLAHIAFRFKQKMNSMNKDKTRSETCLEIPNLSEAISYEYIKNYFSEETKKQVKTIVDLIINKMTEGVKSTVWMDEKIKTLLTQKIQNIGKLVGYPDYYSKSFIDQMYKDYRFGPNFMESVLNFLKFNANYNFRQIRRTFSRDRWVRRPTDVIASYIVTANSINIPAAILQPPIFQIDRPAVLNFAIIGFIIAHEISHSFDIQGRKFDKDGNVIDSWSPEMIEIYRVLSLCFIDQYNKYPVPKLPNRKRICLDGYLTLGENIADTIALLIAFHTYKQFKMENGNKDVRLPTLNEYTSEQLFFMYLAYFHCTNMNPKIIEKKLKTDCHAPRQFRLIGSISNNPDFGKAFNCTIGDPMYPANRCSILVL